MKSRTATCRFEGEVMGNAKYIVVTMRGWRLFGPRDLQACRDFIRKARENGARTEDMRIVPA